MDRDMVATSLQRQLAECEPACRAACLAVHPAHTIELNGPAGDYPLALGLALLAAESGKPWGFIVSPKTWTSDEWQRVTEAVAHLKDRPIFYHTGFKTVNLTTRLTVSPTKANENT